MPHFALSGRRHPLTFREVSEALLQVLHEADVPDIITDVLLEWRRRALNSLTALKHSEAVDALRGIVEHILTSSPLSD